MSYYFLYPLFWLIGRLPRRVLRWVASFFYFVIYKVVKYRVSVVKSNLRNCFKDKSEQELLDIEEKFYRHLADVFVETMEMSSVSEKELKKRMNYLNVDQIEKFTEGRSWIASMAHYGSWEYATIWGKESRHDKNYVVYRPLHNKGFDRYFRKFRSRFGMEPLAMENVGREIIRNRMGDQAISIGMVCDQTPPPSLHMNWFPFLGQMTPFFTGMEKMALKFKMPIGFLNVEKLEPESYAGWFEVIYDGKERVEPGEITRRYIAKCEEMIIRRPELWMWSHRRWKYQYPGDRKEEDSQEEDSEK